MMDGYVALNCHYNQILDIYLFIFLHFLSSNYEMISKFALAHYLSNKVICNVH